MGNINETFFLVAVDPTIKISTELVQLLYFEHIYKFFLRLYNQRLCRGNDYDIVDIKTKKDIFVFIYKAIYIQNKYFEAIFFEYKNNSVISLFRKTI